MSAKAFILTFALLITVSQVTAINDININVEVVVPIGTSSSEVVLSADQTNPIESPETNTTLELVSSQDVSGDIDLIMTPVPLDIPHLSVPSLNRYLNIEASESITDSLTYVIIKIYYTDDEVTSLSLDESSLSIYWWNQTIFAWEKLTPDMDWVHDTGVDTVDNYVWANVTHFSDYGIGGLPQSLKITRYYPAEVEINKKFGMNLMLNSLVDFDLVNVFIREKIPKGYKINKKKIFPKPIFIGAEKDFTVIYWWVGDLGSHSEMTFSYSLTSPRKEGTYTFNADSLGFDSSNNDYTTTDFSMQEVKKKSLMQNIMEILGY